MLEEHQGPACRRALIAIMVARATGDDHGLDQALSQARSIVLPRRRAHRPICPGAGRSPGHPVAEDTEKLAAPVQKMIGHVKEIVAESDLAPSRITRLSQVLEQTQRALVAKSPQGSIAGQATTTPLVDAIEAELEGMLQKRL